MCTASWFFTQHNPSFVGYDIFFNRDEQKTRVPAHPPQQNTRHGIQCIFPLDPEGSGTWISVNEFAISLCLLNYYQQPMQPIRSVCSRGIIIRELAHLQSLAEIEQVLLKLLAQKSFSPFTLLVFSATCNTPSALQFDGQTLLHIQASSPMISSAIDYPAVYQQRLHAYRHLISTKNNLAQHYHFHRSHQPTANQQAVCMHRDDAHSVSLSHIHVDQHGIEFNYFPGSPCQHNTAQQIQLKH